MKGKRYTTEDKIRILREGDRGKSILEVCRAHNISEVSFHRWKRQFGQMDLNEARKLTAAGQTAAGVERKASARRLPAHRRAFTPGGMGGGYTPHPAAASGGWVACAAH